MSSTGTVIEGESYEACATISQQIARQLDVGFHIQADTVDSSKNITLCHVVIIGDVIHVHR